MSKYYDLSREEIDLYELMEKYSNWYAGKKPGTTTNAICNALRRGGICTVDDLIEASPERIQKIRTIGGIRLAIIMVAKLELEEERAR